MTEKTHHLLLALSTKSTKICSSRVHQVQLILIYWRLPALLLYPSNTKRYCKCCIKKNTEVGRIYIFRISSNSSGVDQYSRFLVIVNVSLHTLATSIYLSTCFDAESISPMELCSVDNLDSYYSYGAMSSTLSRSSFFVVTFFDMIS